MLQKKQTTEMAGFKPLPFVIEKNRKGGITVKSSPIDWTSLDEDETLSQKLYCYNVLWEMEKEGLISREHLEPYFYNTLEKSGYSKDDIKNIRKLKDWQISFTLLKIPFMLSQGMRCKESIGYFKSKVDELIKKGKDIVEVQKIDAKPRPSIQDNMAEQKSNILGELQGLEDNMLDEKQDILKWLQTKNVAKAYIGDIEAFYKPRLEELQSIGDDDQLKEAYSCYSKKQIKTMIAWYEALLSDLDAYKRVKQSQQKVRARKPKSPAQLVRKLKYLMYSDEYKIQSIKAESIIGADTLWLFNTKTRRLCVYNASEIDKELTVKGTTILGWDPKTSVGKTLRKPEEQLKEFMAGGKVAMRNFLKNIRGKEALLNGRVNKDMLILKIY